MNPNIYLYYNIVNSRYAESQGEQKTVRDIEFF